MPVVTLSGTGQIMLPQVLRQALGLQEGDQLEITIEGDRLVLTRVSSVPAQPWQRWRGRLAGTQALQAHVADHADEVHRERLS
jgi:AbrB family looped-hinge helix DNA binding protein